MAEDKFNPNFRPELSLSLDRNQTGQTATTGRQARLSADATLKNPLGGELQIKLTGQERGESFEDELVNAQNQELNAVIEYLNSLTLLEQTLGVTLDRWNVFLQEE